MQNTANYKFKKPENTDLYNVQDFSDNMDAIDTALKGIEDGTTTVGNANKLGGKSASEYALAEQITNNSIWTKLTEGFDLNNALGKYRNHSGAVVYTLLNLPPTSLYLRSCEIAVEWFPSHPNNTYGEQVVTLTNGGAIEEFKRHKNGDTWGAWKQTATTADLANYLSKSGGRINGVNATPLTIQSADRPVYLNFENVYGLVGALGFTDVDTPVYIPNTFDKIYRLLHSGNVGDYALSKSGGKVSTSSSTPFSVENAGGGNVMIDFLVNGVRKGLLGFNGTDNPIFYDTNHKEHNILHGGNYHYYALPLTGGTVTSPYGTVMTLRSTAGNEVVMQYRNSADDNEGSLGFNGIDNPIFKKTDGTNLQLLHTGNSAKVAIQSTAPTDTSALWVW